MNLKDMSDDELQAKLGELAAVREANRTESKSVAAELERRAEARKLDSMLSGLTKTQRDQLVERLALAQTVEVETIGASTEMKP